MYKNFYTIFKNKVKNYPYSFINDTYYYDLINNVEEKSKHIKKNYLNPNINNPYDIFFNLLLSFKLDIPIFLPKDNNSFKDLYEYVIKNYDESIFNRCKIITQSSGTTGKPKTIILYKNHLIKNTLNMVKANNFNDNITLLKFSAYTHPLSIDHMFLPAMLQGHNLILKDFSLKNIKENLPKTNGVIFTPQEINILKQNSMVNNINIKNLNYILMSGSKILVDDIKLFLEKDIEVIVFYGSTEVGVAFHNYFKTFNYVNKYYFMNNGEGVLLGDKCFLDYYIDNDNVLHIKDYHTTSNIWYNMEDIVKKENGLFYFCGRSKNIFKTKDGILINPENLEEYINKSLNIKNSVVFPEKTKYGSIKTSLLLEDNDTINNDSVINTLKYYDSRINIYNIYRGKVKLNSSSKINRNYYMNNL